mmetsp:Transcript_5334/g.9487  ORF Transcript_5334/g.9487 Transcript_5334/m.9487 type:complete len:203 (+) Transcript_5334:74-682(+)
MFGMDSASFSQPAVSWFLGWRAGKKMGVIGVSSGGVQVCLILTIRHVSSLDKETNPILFTSRIFLSIFLVLEPDNSIATGDTTANCGNHPHRSNQHPNSRSNVQRSDIRQIFTVGRPLLDCGSGFSSSSGLGSGGGFSRDGFHSSGRLRSGGRLGNSGGLSSGSSIGSSDRFSEFGSCKGGGFLSTKMKTSIRNRKRFRNPK